MRGRSWHRAGSGSASRSTASSPGARDDLRGGLGALVAGVVIFLVGFLFFEGVIDLSDGRFGNLTGVAVPLLLVGIGVIVLVGAFVPGPWHRRQ